MKEDFLTKITANRKVKITVTAAVLPAIILVLVAVIVMSIMQPVNFNRQKAFRESVAIERLKDIRTLEVAYKGMTGKFAADIDSLVDFYNNGDMVVKMQIGSKDDSLTLAHTREIRQQKPWLKGVELNKYLYELYQQGDKNLAFSIDNRIPVRDTLFKDRKNFCPDSLRYIPFSGGTPVELEAVLKQVSGVSVPLFEARMSYRELLKGLDNQLRINLDAECRTKNRFEGLQVGSVSAPNNNAGNWE